MKKIALNLSLIGVTILLIGTLASAKASPKHYETSELACVAGVIKKHSEADMVNAKCAPATIMKNVHTHRYNVSGTDISGKVNVFKQEYEGKTYFTLSQ